MTYHRVLLSILFSAGALAQEFDVLIRNGRIADGTGNPSFHADVAIKDGRIAALGRLGSRTAARVIDAKGLVVTPGFIDMHNHSDNNIIEDGDAQSMIRMGVTSMILGEGSSAAPSARFPRFRDYWAALLKSGVSTNIGSYVGSGLIYGAAHGSKPGPATAAEVQKMRETIRQAMEDGALGVSASLHQTPGFWITTDELVEMAKVAGEYGGIYSSHTRSEGETVFESIGEAIEVGRRAGVPVDLLHLKIAHFKLWGQMPELIGTISNARAQGVDVEGHLYPYTAGQNAGLSNIIPPWAHEGGNAAMLKRLQDPSLRARLEKDITEGIPGWYNHYTAIGSDWSKIQIVSAQNPAYRKYIGKRVSELFADKKKPWLDALFETLIDNQGSVPALYYHHTESDMTHAMKQPFVSFGSDGSAMRIDEAGARGMPHPRSFGTFARVMGHYVRDQKTITLEEAVRKATSHNAAKVRLYDRGLLRPGMWGDVTVFNPGTIGDKATYENPFQYAVGVDYVLVNGKIVIDQGRHTGARPGAILYGPGTRVSTAAPPATEHQAAALRELIAKSPRSPRQATPMQIQLPVPDWNTDYISSTASSGDGTVYVLHRNANFDPVVAIDGSGRILRSWGKGLYANPHSVRVDPEGNIWTVDSRSSVVLKFTPQGRQLLRFEIGELPEGGRGTRGAADIAFAPGGRVYIADGYGNARVLEYDGQGKRVRQWGSAGTGPGQFNLPHGLTVVDGTVYVADRQNGRIQWFNLEGRYLGEWNHLGKTFSITAAPDGNLWIGTHPRNVANEAPGWLVNVERKTGKILGWVESAGLHSVDVDAAGDVLADPGRGNLNRVVWFRLPARR